MIGVVLIFIFAVLLCLGALSVSVLRDSSSKALVAQPTLPSGYVLWVSDEGGYMRVLILMPDDTTMDEDIVAVNKFILDEQRVAKKPVLLSVCGTPQFQPFAGKALSCNDLWLFVPEFQ